MRPNEIVDIEPFMIIDYFPAGNALFYNMHLSGHEVGSPTLTRGGQTWQMSATLNIRLSLALRLHREDRRVSPNICCRQRALRKSALKYQPLVGGHMLRRPTFELEPDIRRNFTSGHHLA